MEGWAKRRVSFPGVPSPVRAPCVSLAVEPKGMIESVGLITAQQPVRPHTRNALALS